MHTISPELSFPSDFDQTALQNLLHPNHPRLLATAEDWERLRQQIPESPELQGLVAMLKLSAEMIRNLPPHERVLEGRRMLSTSREVLRRILTTGTLYRLTGEEQYRKRTLEELLHVATFPDWNPSHFLDTAEMTLAFALGYDWLYDTLSEEEESILRKAIVEKGLTPGRGPHGFKTGNNNWNQVCFAGMLAGALAVADHEPEIALEFLRETMANIHRPLDMNRPHGAYPEGPGYWSYGMHFQVILHAILQSAFGTTWDLDQYPAMAESAVYINLMIAPSGEYFNYADSGSRPGSLSALHWFAAQAGNPTLDQRERQALRSWAEDTDHASTPGDPRANMRLLRDRFLPLALFWMDPQLATHGEPQPLPLHWRADGPNPVAVHRDGGGEANLYFAIKGGSPRVNHAHMDIGSFIFEAMGVRWAIDLGSESYTPLETRGMQIWNSDQDSDRWRVFRLNSHSHNTLVIDGGQQHVDGHAPILAFSDHPDHPHTQIDMTPVYPVVKQALRTARFLPREGVLLHDQITGLTQEQEVRWGMVTRAEITLQESEARLQQDGQTLHAQILSPADATFAIVQTDQPPNAWDSRNQGTRMLALHLNGTPENNPQDIRILLTIQPPTPERSEELRKWAPPD